MRPRLRRKKERGHICDAAMTDGRRWALFEITSSRLTRESVLGTSEQRLDGDFAKLLGKIEQLHDTICVLRDRESVLTEEAVHRRRRFHPVLVLTETFPTNPLTTTMLRERAREAGFLRGDDVAELEIVEVTELEIAEGAHLGEPGLLDVLDAKQHSMLHRSSLRDFLVLDQKTAATTSPRVSAKVKDAWRIARSVLQIPDEARSGPADQDDPCRACGEGVGVVHDPAVDADAAVGEVVEDAVLGDSGVS